MFRWLVCIVLVVASPTVWAQAPRATASATAQAQDTMRSAERRLATVSRERQALTTRYAEETSAIERLKKQRSSWRQQRELKDKLAVANDTAAKLRKLDQQVAAAEDAVSGARRQLVASIDAEIATSPSAVRTAELERLKRQVQPSAGRRVARIVLPALEVDPLADPEDLEAQAAAMRDGEAQLIAQISSLDRQSRELDTVAELRKQHDRASELSRRDDDAPQRTRDNGGAAGGRVATQADSSGRPDSEPPPQAPETGVVTHSSSFEAEVSVALSEVVDPTTIETLNRAARSGDPSQRAAATRRTRDAVKLRLQQLQRKRLEVEALAKHGRRP